MTLTEPIVLIDVTNMIDRQLADGAWHYGALVDARRAILGPAEDRALLEHLLKVAAQHGPHGPTAVVRRTDLGGVQAFAFRSGLVGRTLEVFWDIDDADRWLISQLPPLT